VRKITYLVAGIILFSSVISVISWGFLTEEQEQPLQTGIKSVQDINLERAEGEERITATYDSQLALKVEPSSSTILEIFMSKINQGYSEDCLQENIDGQMHRSCFLTDDWTIQKSDTLTMEYNSWREDGEYVKILNDDSQLALKVEPLIYKPNFDFFMSKINQGFTEVCLQENIDGQMYRSCFLTDEWTIQKIDTFYIYMETENFCVYRQFTEQGYSYFNSTFYDSKIHAELYDEPLCGEYKLLKWEHRDFDLTQIPYEGRNYFYLTCKDCTLESNMLWNEKNN